MKDPDQGLTPGVLLMGHQQMGIGRETVGLTAGALDMGIRLGDMGIRLGQMQLGMDPHRTPMYAGVAAMIAARIDGGAQAVLLPVVVRDRSSTI
jgi:hypothetical protein